MHLLGVGVYEISSRRLKRLCVRPNPNDRRFVCCRAFLTQDFQRLRSARPHCRFAALFSAAPKESAFTHEHLPSAISFISTQSPDPHPPSKLPERGALAPFTCRCRAHFARRSARANLTRFRQASAPPVRVARFQSRNLRPR